MQGEHGTGRNVAPYVEMEWGTKAYQLMWELKELFDRDYVLNPGVILNNVRACAASSVVIMTNFSNCTISHAVVINTCLVLESGL